MPPFDAEQYISRRKSRKIIPDLKPTGELYSVNVGCTVRRGAVGKVPLDGNSLAAYPTFESIWGSCQERPQRSTHLLRIETEGGHIAGE